MKITESTIDATQRPMRADARRNHDRVLAAGREVFGESGVEAQMDDVARCAGVGVGTVYRHFPTKEALMGELVRQKFVLFVVHAREALSSGQASFEALTASLRRDAEQMARDAATRYAMGTGTAVLEAATAEIDELNELTAELIARAHRAGTLREDLTVADIPMLMCGVCNSMDRGLDWRRHLELTLDGLRVRQLVGDTGLEPAIGD
ncbi:MAG: TetR/AcrR family transcriptional regulator [Solirubrobacteraceae bacterium]